MEISFWKRDSDGTYRHTIKCMVKWHLCHDFKTSNSKNRLPEKLRMWDFRVESAFPKVALRGQLWHMGEVSFWHKECRGEERTKGPGLITMSGADYTHCALSRFLTIVLLTLSNKNILVSKSCLKISSSTEAMRAQGTFVNITFCNKCLKLFQVFII